LSGIEELEDDIGSELLLSVTLWLTDELDEDCIELEGGWELLALLCDNDCDRMDEEDITEEEEDWIEDEDGTGGAIGDPEMRMAKEPWLTQLFSISSHTMESAGRKKPYWKGSVVVWHRVGAGNEEQWLIDTAIQM
jgi:hypothetical protein